ncbi:MAG: dephospho-CoA kinase [Dehalococcoidia bacterium]
MIGLAGSIASGKSTVAQLLVERGAIHCDADKLVHRLYDPGTPGFERVVAAFGEDIVGPDGYVDRKKLGAKVFGKPEEMAKLTRAMGSITETIYNQLETWRRELGPGQVAVLEAVNLMEPGYAAKCDQTWLIGIGDDIALQRLMASRGLTEAEARQRLASQRPFDARAGGADWTCINDGTLDDLRDAVNAEFDRILALHQRGELPRSKFHAWYEAFEGKAEELAKRRPTG